MEIYYTDTSDPAVYNINPTNNAMNLLYNNENFDDDDELQYYEYGAHFKYNDLVARLTTLLHASLQEAPTTTFSPNKPAIQITKSRNTATTHAKLVDKDNHPQNNLYFRLNNGNINNNNNHCMCSNKAKLNEHSSTAIKQNKKPNRSSLAISSLTVIDKISKLTNNTNTRIKAKTNSNSNCSYQNINNNIINNKQPSPPSTINNKFIKTNISSIKYQNTNNSSSSNKSNPNLILCPSSSKSKSQLKAISELLKSKISKGKNSVTNNNNISSYTSSNKSRNVTKTTNKTVNCILNHNNIHNHNNNRSNCFGLQYAQTKPHSVDRKMSNNTSRKITAYHTKPKGSSGYTANAHAHAYAHAQNTILVSTLNSHNNNNNNNTTQSSQYNMDLSLTSSMKHNNDGYAVRKSKQIKQKLISVAKNSDNAVNHCNSSSSKTKSSSQQKQKIPSRNIRNSSVIKNTINRTQNSHGCGNNINTSNCQCKKGNSNNSGNCYSNTINSHTSSKKKLFTNSTNVNHAISTMMHELKVKQQLKK